MNREIKFRAWDKGNQQMIYPLPMGTLPSGELLLRWDDEHLMQFTGIKDKNGKDIYEGDIIKIKDGRITGQHYDYDNDDYIELYEDHIALVEYNEDSFCYEHGCAGCLCPLSTDIDKITIIGNIYENPKLLKQ